MSPGIEPQRHENKLECEIPPLEPVFPIDLFGWDLRHFLGQSLGGEPGGPKKANSIDDQENTPKGFEISLPNGNTKCNEQSTYAGKRYAQAMSGIVRTKL